MIPAVTPPHSRPIESYSHETFRQSYGPNHHDKSAVNRKLLHEINSAVIPPVASTHSRLIGNYSQQILMQPYGSKHHINSATNRIFFYEINPAVMISAAKSQTCNISIQFPGSNNQSANFINKRNHDHANDSPHNSHHHKLYLIHSEHGDNPPPEGLSSVATSYSLSLIENSMQHAPIWKASSSLFTQVERRKAVGVPKTSKYSDTHTHGSMLTTDLCIPLCSLRSHVSLYANHGSMYSFYAHHGPVYPFMLTTDLYITLCSPRTCIPLYAHYGPVYPVCSLRTCISLYAHYRPAYPSMLTTVTSNSAPNARTLPTTQHPTTSLPTGVHNPTSTPASSTPQTLPTLPSAHLNTMTQYELHITLHGTVISHPHSLELRLLHTIQCTLSPLVVYSILGPHDDPLSQHLPPDLHTPATNDSQPMPLYITDNNYNTSDITRGTQPMDTHTYHANDSPHNNNPHHTSPAARYCNRPAQDSASQAEHSNARKQPSTCCETSSHKLTATAHSANAHSDSSRTRDLMEEDPTADFSLSSHTLTLSSQCTDKRPKAKVSSHTGNPLPHNSVPNVRTLPTTHHPTT